MAVCRTCGTQVEVPEGWSVGPAVRRHYWQEHPEHMQRTRADKQAEAELPPRLGAAGTLRPRPAELDRSQAGGGGVEFT